MRVSITKRGALQFEGDGGKGGYFAIDPKHVLIMTFQNEKEKESVDVKCYNAYGKTGISMSVLKKAVRQVLHTDIAYEV